MRALRLMEEEQLSFDEVTDPPPGAGEVLLRTQALSLNHFDLFGVRGIAFAKRALPLIVGVEGSGVVEAVGPGVDHVRPGDLAIV